MKTNLEQDYWPGYLDALINVMLYLLLLVGSFALGMVALTLHSMKQQQQLSSLDAKDVDRSSEVMQKRASEILAQMNLTEAERALISERLMQMDIKTMVRRREELDRQLQLAELRDAQRQQAQQLTQNSMMKAPEPRPSMAKNSATRETDSLKAELAALEEEYQNALMALDREKRLSVQQRETPPPKTNEVIFDLRVMAKSGGAANTGARETVAKLFDRDPKVTWEFDSSQFLWGVDKPVPDGLADVDVSSSWKLVIFADTNNSRIVRESFARVNSVREALVRKGFARELIKVEVRPFQGGQFKDERLLRTVFMLQDA